MPVWSGKEPVVLGFPDQALQRGDEAITLARDISHSYSVVFALVFNAMLHQHRRDAQRTRQQAEAAIALATEQELVHWLPWATALRGWAMAEQGHAEEGIVQLRQAIVGWTAVGSGALAPYFEADANLVTRRPVEPLAVICWAALMLSRFASELAWSVSDQPFLAMGLLVLGDRRSDEHPGRFSDHLRSDLR